MNFDGDFQTKEQLRNYYHELKTESNIYTPKIQYWLDYQSHQQEKIIERFNINDVHIEPYNLPFGVIRFINNTASMMYKQRPGRRLTLTVWHGNTYIGLIQYASPVMNSRLTNILKEKYGKFDFRLLNDRVVELSICVPSGIIAIYLGGKMLVFIAMSEDIINKYRVKYGAHTEVMFTTSIFGKSSMYNRVRGLKYLGLTKGYNSALSKQQTEYIQTLYREKYPQRKITKSAIAPHIIRMYDHLIQDGVALPFKIYRMQRGVYLADEFSPLQDNLNYFYHRWFVPRRNMISMINNKNKPGKF